MREKTALGLCAALALGEGVGLLAAELGPLWPAIAALTAIVVLVGYGLKAPGWRFVAMALTGLSLALCHGSRIADVVQRASSRNGASPFEASVEVLSEPRVVRDREGAVWASFTGSVEGLKAKVMLTVEDEESAPGVGERWRCAGWLSSSRSESWRRVFYVHGRGTWSRRESEAPFSRRLSQVRSALSDRVGIGLGYDRQTADLNRAILLGERARMPRRVREAFVGAGTIHVFAISGLHVGVLAKLAVVAMCVMFVPLRIVALPLVPLIAAYVWMIGAPPSAVRAAAMACVYYSAYLFDRRPNGLIAWSWTFLIVHLMSPDQLFNVGSALSFAVMLSLILSGRVAGAFRGRVIPKLIVAFGAWAAGVPIAAQVFGKVTPGGLVANLAMLPAAVADVVVGAVGLLSSFVSTALAAHVNNLAALITRAMVGVSTAVASLPGSNLETDNWTWWDSVRWYALAILSFWLLNSVKRRHNEKL